MPMKNEIHVRIRDISEKEYEELKNVALHIVGTPSIAALAKHLLLKQTEARLNKAFVEAVSKRTEIRLNTKTKDKLQQLAAQENMSLNRYIVMLLNNYVETKKIMSRTQLQALRESNYQLFQIGKNINQIAKALNQGLPATVSSAELEKIYHFIDKHTEEVRQVIVKTPSL